MSSPVPTPSTTSPGVYVTEVPAFPNDVAPVATAIPAFVGYTARASYQGESVIGRPVPISSLADYLACFGLLDETGTPLPDLVQTAPVYYPVPAADPQNADLIVGGAAYDVGPDPATVYYLYPSVKLFFQNGGGTCYVVSVGLYGAPSGVAKAKADPLVNPRVGATALAGGLAALNYVNEVTMIVIPDATLLPQADHATLTQLALAQCAALGSRVGIFDVWHGDAPDPLAWENDIAAFRTGVGLGAGANGLSYGVAYYPFLQTTVTTDADIDYTNLGGAATLSAFLPEAGSEPVKTLLAAIGQPSGSATPTPAQIEDGLRTASPTYRQLHDIALTKINILPTAGALAGVYTNVDSAVGVWQAPANVSLVAVTDTTLRITDPMQAGLNVDAATGKSINAIRLFPGRGVIVWGARTLDGNSDDWRYVNVRRTVILIEQTVTRLLAGYVFAANDSLTWMNVQSAISRFLTGLWAQGGLTGPSASAAFSVAVGLGTTMTADDILNGILRVSVKVAVTHPAEFIVITVEQRMQAAS